MIPDDGGFEYIGRSIFRVETTWSGRTATGTGFVVGMIRDSRKIILATARHCLEVPEDEVVSWRVQHFDEFGKVDREVAFGTHKQRAGDTPYRTHKSFDVGLLVLPSRSDADKFFALEDEKPICVIDPRKGVSTGTRVQWAGFPGEVEAALGGPQICCFGGQIAAMINRQERSHYVVDGHGMRGVSGGPVWHWSDERDRLEVVGIVAEYRPLPQGLPGFCLFEPVNPVMQYLEWWRTQITDDFIITNCRS
jgi:hypothetical protein